MIRVIHTLYEYAENLAVLVQRYNKAGSVRPHSDLVANVSMWGSGEYYALRCIGSWRKRRQVTQQKAGVQGPWLYDRRVRWLLELTIDEDEHVRFGIEGIDSQCIIALEERLLVIKPGFVRGGVFGAKAASIRDGDGTDFGGKVASIRYGDITSIETKVASSNSVIKINALDYRLNKSHNEIYQGNHVAPARDFMLSEALTTIPITRWALAKAKPYLYIIADFIGEAKEE